MEEALDLSSDRILNESMIIYIYIYISFQSYTNFYNIKYNLKIIKRSKTPFELHHEDRFIKKSKHVVNMVF